MKPAMAAKERVMTTFSHQEPDRVPVGYSANGGIDRRLHQALGLKEGEGVGAALGVDYRGIWVPYKGKRLHPEIEGRGVNEEWGIRTRWIEHPTGGYWDYCDFPLREADEETIAKWPMPDPDDYDYSSIAESVGSVPQVPPTQKTQGGPACARSAPRRFSVRLSSILSGLNTEY